MCMFTRPVEHVSATQIFARGLDDGRQVLVYAMQLATREPLAMVLPIPVPAGSADDAVEFVSLEGYPDFFADLKRAFPSTLIARHEAASAGRFVPRGRTLKVAQVGAFEASFVPHARDFRRLDPRFSLAPDVLAALPQYADWGFVVFQLDKTKRSVVHPMAFAFPRRAPGSIFFPTVHVHDGGVPLAAAFDHELYAQLPPLLDALVPWMESRGPLSLTVDEHKARGLVDTRARGRGVAIVGERDNVDTYFVPPIDVTVEDLAGAGECYTYRVRADYHYAEASHPMYPRWRATSATKLPRLCRGIRVGLATLVAENARAWQLGPLDATLRPHFLNGTQLWSGTSHQDGSSSLIPGPGLVRFTPFSDAVEQQDITLGFTQVPAPADAIAIDRALAAMLERAVAA